MPPGANKFCMSMDSWTAFEIGSSDCGSAITLRPLYEVTFTPTAPLPDRASLEGESEGDVREEDGLVLPVRRHGLS
jgi:hypothetical protein